MACLAATLALLVVAVRLWPAPAQEPGDRPVYHTRAQEVISIEQIQPTSQSRLKPPPPAPAPPIAVPDEVLLPDEELDLDAPFNLLADAGETGDAPSAPAGPPAGERTTTPEVGPKTVRFVEPEYTREARRRNVRAQIVIEVLVDEQGRVRESKIVERFLLGKDQAERRAVATVGYGLEEAALSAAERWVFRPARQQGKPVSSYTMLTFTFGV